MHAGSEAPFRETVSKRFDVLDALAEEPRSKQDLTDCLEQSRSTIDRAIRELETATCVRPVEPGRPEYQLTQIGRLGFEYEQGYRDRMSQVESNAALLNSIPEDAPLDPAFVAGAETHFSPRTPDVAFKPGAELVSEADRMLGTATVAREQYFEILGGQLAERDFELELVMPTDLLGAIQENYQQELAQLTDASGVAIYETQARVPYALWITESESTATAGITLHQNGGVKGSLINTSDAAVRWARDQYEAYREQSTRIF
jgi:predicted transcriptional regulator